MVAELPGMTLKAIGTVRSKKTQPPQPDAEQAVSEIVVDGALTEALDGLEEFSHIIVLYWMHQAPACEPSTKVHLGRREELPLVGLFATRSPHRPNPIGLTTVRLLQRRGNILVVQGLDAVDGTPVLDIKPHIPGCDSVADATVPQWLTTTHQISQKLRDLYRRLMDYYGPQHWWPAEEPFEMIVGAILTQATAWSNVEKAIANLKAARALSPRALRRMPLAEVAALIYPCGYYNAKARKLKAFAHWLGEHYDDNLDRLWDNDIGLLRRQLLSIHGIGEETADSIILYGAGKPIFVIDAYTRRIIDCLGLTPKGNSYAAYQSLFMSSLPADSELFQEYHALLVRLAKDVCRNRPLCRQCCLRSICPSRIN